MPIPAHPPEQISFGQTAQWLLSPNPPHIILETLATCTKAFSEFPQHFLHGWLRVVYFNQFDQPIVG